MEQLRFYILHNSNRGHAACRIAEKAVAQGHRVHVRVPDPQAAQELDKQMWTFRSQSFLPHGVGEPPSPHVRVTIHEQWLPEERDVLINLAPDVLAEFESFTRVAEIVGADDEDRQLGRQRFRQYRDRGFDPETLEISR